MAVFAFLIEEGHPNQLDNEIINDWIIRKNIRKITDSRPIQLPIPGNLLNYWRYSGGLTTPGCEGVVRWTIFEETVKISTRQAQEIGSWAEGRLSKNNREVQDLNKRVVFRFGSSDALILRFSFKSIFVTLAVILTVCSAVFFIRKFHLENLLVKAVDEQPLLQPLHIRKYSEVQQHEHSS